MAQLTMDQFMQESKALREKSKDICQRILAEIKPESDAVMEHAQRWTRRLCAEIQAWHDNPVDVPNPETSSTSNHPTVTHGTRELGEKRGYAPGEFFL